MAKTVKLESETTLIGVKYPEGTVLSVCEEIFDSLGLPEYVEPKPKPTPTKG